MHNCFEISKYWADQLIFFVLTAASIRRFAYRVTSVNMTNGRMIIASIQSGDITKTIVLATVGAVVSFVSLGLKWIAKKWSRSR